MFHLHHVVERLGLSVWDHVFVGSGVVMILIGLAVIRSARRDGAPGPV